jgi:hypothetical protein
MVSLEGTCCNIDRISMSKMKGLNWAGKYLSIMSYQAIYGLDALVQTYVLHLNKLLPWLWTLGVYRGPILIKLIISVSFCFLFLFNLTVLILFYHDVFHTLF